MNIEMINITNVLDKILMTQCQVKVINVELAMLNLQKKKG